MTEPERRVPVEPLSADGVDPDGAVEVVVEGGFLKTLLVEGRPSVETIRSCVNSALLTWYQREDAARAALDAALEQAASLQTPTLIGQATLPDPPSWVEPVARFLEDGPGGADRSHDPK